MPTPRSVTIRISTQDDHASKQNLQITAEFDPSLDPSEESFLCNLAAAILNGVQDLQSGEVM